MEKQNPISMEEYLKRRNKKKMIENNYESSNGNIEEIDHGRLFSNGEFGSRNFVLQIM